MYEKDTMIHDSELDEVLGMDDEEMGDDMDDSDDDDDIGDDE